MARTKSIHRMVTGDENKDPVALEAANESMATSTDAPRNSSSQRNEKKLDAFMSVCHDLCEDSNDDDDGDHSQDPDLTPDDT